MRCEQSELYAILCDLGGAVWNPENSLDPRVGGAFLDPCAAWHAITDRRWASEMLLFLSGILLDVNLLAQAGLGIP